MNPKAMPRHQLLGHIDMDTREWADGVLTNSARNVVREPQGKNSNIARLCTLQVKGSILYTCEDPYFLS